ncbi:MAG: methylisocitrate lyase [Planctomycetota bacterium]|nr:MAG: methylisocitrate lyase [Planctomycetota bacterium]
MTTPHPGARLRSLMDASVVAAPGAFNALVARAVAQAGFDAAYVSGGATSVAAGVPDVGLLTLEHFCRVIREVADGSGLPVLADADTGFGEAEMTRRTVIEYHRAGAAGLHLEDQVFPKRCGHLDGKTLVPSEHMCEKVEWAAKASRDCSGGAFVVCARTDARGVDGMDAAVERAKAYVGAGADMIFPEGLKTEAEFAEFAEALRSDSATKRQSDGGRVYLLANMTEFGKTPLISLSRFGEMGYDLVIYPVSMLRVAMGAVTRALETLKAEGTVEPLLGGMQTREELYGLVGYTPGEAWETPV